MSKTGLQVLAAKNNAARRIHPIRLLLLFALFVSLASSAAYLSALESDTFRLLSVSESSKLILVSKIPSKTKFMLDASTAKITVDGKPAEFTSLKVYSIIQVTIEARKSSKEGIDVDGVAKEIKINTPPSP